MSDLPVIILESGQKWEEWLIKNHETKGVWLRIAKKNSGVQSVSYQEAVDISLCYGWIDGQKKKFDELTYMQRFTPRKPKSNWSKINKEKALKFISEGKMKPQGLKTIENAKQSGAWNAAYDSQSTMKVPEDLKKALSKNPGAKAFFETLNNTNKFAVLTRIQTARTPEKRAEKIEKMILMLERNEKFHN